MSHVQIGIESAQIFLSSPLAEAPPQTSTSPALFGVRSMHIAKSHADNPPSTCDGLLQTRPKQHIWGPLPQVPFQGPPRVEPPRELSCPGSRAAPRAELQRFHSPATLGGPKLISNGRGGASKLAPRRGELSRALSNAGGVLRGSGKSHWWESYLREYSHTGNPPL